MPDLCDDNRFELIKKYKEKLIEATNIEDSPEEMEVIDTIFFRLWQTGWLDKLEKEQEQEIIIHCKDCIHKPKRGFDQDIEFPDDKCPCQCEDYWYSWIPDDDWYCANREM